MKNLIRTTSCTIGIDTTEIRMALVSLPINTRIHIDSLSAHNYGCGHGKEVSNPTGCSGKIHVTILHVTKESCERKENELVHHVDGQAVSAKQAYQRIVEVFGRALEMLCRNNP